LGGALPLGPADLGYDLARGIEARED
jgi:hypothetical protein